MNINDPKWQALNNLEEAFLQITTMDFLLEQLQEAVNEDDRQSIIDITAALTAFHAPYCKNWEKRFSQAWNVLIKDEQR